MISIDSMKAIYRTALKITGDESNVTPQKLAIKWSKNIGYRNKARHYIVGLMIGQELQSFKELDINQQCALDMMITYYADEIKELARTMGDKQLTTATLPS